MLSREMLRAVGDVVSKAGGDMDDVEDLVRTWERLERDSQARADRMRYEAHHVSCCCADGGESTNDRRCRRCWGRL